MIQRVLNIPHLYSYAACTQFLFTLKDDFWLKALKPACATFCSQARTLNSLHHWAAEAVSASTGIIPFQKSFLYYPSHLLSSQHLWARSWERPSLMCAKAEKAKEVFFSWWVTEGTERRLKGWGLLSLGKRLLQEDLMVTHLYQQGSDQGDGATLLQRCMAGWGTMAESWNKSGSGWI